MRLLTCSFVTQALAPNFDKLRDTTSTQIPPQREEAGCGWSDPHAL